MSSRAHVPPGLQLVLVQWSAQAVEDFVFQMPFFTKSEIEERKNKILTITRNIAHLQSTQNTIKESIEGLLKEDARLQAEQNELIEEVKHLLVEIDDGEAEQQKRYGSKKWSWGMFFRAWLHCYRAWLAACKHWALLQSMRYRSHVRVGLEHNRIKWTATKHSILQCIAVLLLLQCIPCESWVGTQQNRVNCYRSFHCRMHCCAAGFEMSTKRALLIRWLLRIRWLLPTLWDILSNCQQLIFQDCSSFLKIKIFVKYLDVR